MTYEAIAKRAVVLGSGMAGLFAARVLADYFGEVVLVDRDDIPSSPRTRSGVPQGKHFHALIAGGLTIANELFPGFNGDLEEAGAVPCVSGRDFFAYRPEGKSYALTAYQPEPRPAEIIYFMSRPLLEHCLRQRVQNLPNVKTRYRSLVREPLTDEGRLTGLVIEGGGRLSADLVVDATGRNGRTAQWLENLGFEAPSVSVVNCDFGYASAVVRPADPEALGGAGFFVTPARDGPYNTRGAALVRIEGNQWLGGPSTAGGRSDAPCPTPAGTRP
jgi:2-polyprenyl-6-methoxyphenol hydroxylase-like FAD-dependent oxidoreductase